jgi:hypothetical protein
MYDLDGDGKITRVEMLEIIEVKFRVQPIEINHESYAQCQMAPYSVKVVHFIGNSVPFRPFMSY